MIEKLYNLRYGDKIKLLETSFPPDYPEALVAELMQRTFTFKHIDGMYSLCICEKGEVHHPVAWSECEVLNKREEACDRAYNST